MHCFRVHISLWIHHFFMPWLFYLKGAAPESGEPSVPYTFGDEGLRADVRRRTWGWMKSWTWPGNVLSKPRKISCALAASKAVWPPGRGRGFYPSTLVRHHLECCVQLWDPAVGISKTRGCGPVWESLEEAQRCCSTFALGTDWDI